jgi:hypothetical protein
MGHVHRGRIAPRRSRPVPLRDAIAVGHRPVLIIAGGGVPDEPTAARWFQAASPAAVRVWVVPHVGHTAALATQPGEWDEQVTSFLAAALNPAAAAVPCPSAVSCADGRACP